MKRPFHSCNLQGEDLVDNKPHPDIMEWLKLNQIEYKVIVILPNLQGVTMYNLTDLLVLQFKLTFNTQLVFVNKNQVTTL